MSAMDDWNDTRMRLQRALLRLEEQTTGHWDSAREDVEAGLDYLERHKPESGQ